MKHLGKVLCILFLFTSEVISQSLEAELVAILKNELRAFQTKNPALWDPFVHEDAVFTGLEPGFKTKAQMIEEIRTATDFYNSVTETYEEVLVRQYNDTAVLSCISVLQYTDSSGENRKIAFRFTRIHIKTAAGWRLVHHNAVPF